MHPEYDHLIESAAMASERYGDDELERYAAEQAAKAVEFVGPLDCACTPDSRGWNAPHIVVTADLDDAGEAMVLVVLAAHPPYEAAKADIKRYAGEVEGVERIHVEVIPFATPADAKAEIDGILESIGE